MEMHAEGKWKSLQATEKESEEGTFPWRGSRKDAII